MCRVDGQVCFVSNALPGDVAQVRVARRTRGVLWGAIVTVLQPSAHRVEAPCPHFGRCGGCTWLHFAYPAQGEWKRRIVEDCLRRIAGLECAVGWAEDARRRLGYRTRATFHPDRDRVGFYAGGSHAVVPIERCALCHDRLNDLLSELRGRRIHQDVEAVVNPDGDEALVWTRRVERGLTGVGAVVESKERTAEPAHFLCGGVPIVNGAFSQSSLLLNRTLLGVVHGMVGETDSLLDLYCGNGNLSLGLMPRMRIRGLDHHNTVIRVLRALGHDAYRTGGEGAFICEIESERGVVLLDPPRTGAKAVVPALAASKASRIVYVSCDPATLSRDLKALISGGWQVSEATAVDLFPHTAHVETVCRLER
ncbi:MAG: TRAM domain-containing protein [Nitrospiraceae bacterium]|nr:TRAM domain-containing protein [Nitrospiraceae bacterium]